MLKDGTLVMCFDQSFWNGVNIVFSPINLDEKEDNEISFFWEDTNLNDNIDVDDDCFYYGTELVEFDEFKKLCEEYLEIDIDKSYSGFSVKNEVEWIVLQEGN